MHTASQKKNKKKTNLNKSLSKKDKWAQKKDKWAQKKEKDMEDSWYRDLLRRRAAAARSWRDGSGKRTPNNEFQTLDL